MRSDRPSHRPGAALAASLRVLGATVFYGAAGVVVLFCLALLVLRLWVVPRLDEYREPIVRAVAGAIGQPVSAGALEVGWDGWNPTLALRDFVIYGEDGQPGLRLPLVRNTLSWRSLLSARIRLSELEIVAPELLLRRDSKGGLHVGGMRLRPEATQEEPGFARWLLQQPRVRVRDGAVIWRDEMRDAAPLRLEAVHVRLDNRGARHRFGLTGVPPPEISAPLDLRGDLRLSTGGKLSAPSGQLYARLDFADLARWAAWIELPFDLRSGLGAVRVWLDVERGEARSVLADVELGEVRARLGRGLPELDLSSLEGRLGWRGSPERVEVTAKGLTLVTALGVRLEPTALSLAWARAEGLAAQAGELEVGALRLEPLEHLAMHLPLSDAWRSRIRQMHPRGTLNELRYAWHGDPMRPDRFSVAGRVRDLALEANAQLPGFSRVSGRLEATNDGGTAALEGEGLVLELPGVLGEPIELETFGGNAAWKFERGGVSVRMQDLVFANGDAAGTASAEYRSLPRGPGWVDLSGTLSRADMTRVHRYLPLGMPERVRTWVRFALLSGRASQASVRVKGDLWEFPFRDPALGTFELTAAIEGATLDYADRWPRIEDIRANLRVAGYAVEVDAREARVGGTRLTRVLARIPDVAAAPARLEVRGEAAGSTESFLRFIDASPVKTWTGGATGAIRTQGQGALSARLDIPLGRYEDTRVAGEFSFADNAVLLGPDIPRIEKAGGRVSFTKGAVRGTALTGEVLGGPVTAEFEIAEGPLRVRASGVADVASVRSAFPFPLFDRASGRTDWRFESTLAESGATWTVDSSLVGVSVALPAPLGKPAEREVPFRMRRDPAGPGADLLEATYGEVGRFRARRRFDEYSTVLERAAISFGPGAVALDRPGIWVRGEMPRLDFNEWLDVYAAAFEGASAAGSSRATGSPAAAETIEGAARFSGFDVRVGEFVLLGRAFPNQSVLARPRGRDWSIEMTGPRLAGKAEWIGEGAGSIVARLARLDLPPDPPAVAPGAAPDVPTPEWPALDVTVEHFVRKDRELGALTLKARTQGRDWNIETLRLASPSGELSASGRTRRGERPARTELEVQLVIADVGDYLRRFGLPDGIKGGKGKIEGRLAWASDPANLDYPTLGGRFHVAVTAGQFTRMDPGIGKLLGVLSLQSIPRRITLDFQDVFSEGFAFDSIEGDIKVAKGLMATDNLRIAGPAAKILMVGEADLSSETQNLKVRVQPTLSVGVAAGALAITGNPLVGGAVLLGQALLRDPIEQMLASEYRVTGAWADPHVEKIVAVNVGEPQVPR